MKILQYRYTVSLIKILTFTKPNNYQSSRMEADTEPQDTQDTQEGPGVPIEMS
jgi:hypothetical protein